jgi:hypothetical protein
LSNTLVGCSGGSGSAGGGSASGSCVASGEASTHSSPSIRNSSNFTTTTSKTERYSKNVETTFGIIHSNDATSGDISNAGSNSNIDIESIKSPTVTNYTSTRATLLPWSSHNRSSIAAANVTGSIDMLGLADNSMRPGELVMRSLFADFVQQAEKKIESVMLESHVSMI